MLNVACFSVDYFIFQILINTYLEFMQVHHQILTTINLFWLTLSPIFYTLPRMYEMKRKKLSPVGLILTKKWTLEIKRNLFEFEFWTFHMPISNWFDLYLKWDFVWITKYDKMMLMVNSFIVQYWRVSFWINR